MFIDGQKIKNDILLNLKEKVQGLDKKPKLSIFTIGDDFVMKSFVKIKKKFAEDVGVDLHEIKLGEEVSEEELISLIEKESQKTNGIVLQLPLPENLNIDKVTCSIRPGLDVDVLSAESYQEFLESNNPKMVPPVAGSVWNILKSIEDEIIGDLVDKKVLIVGNGFLTGKPVYDLLTKKKFKDLEVVDVETDQESFQRKVMEAEILISGTGVPNLIKADMIKEGIILIDMGSSSDKGVLVGDISLECGKKALIFSKTPGGVGPGTVAVLFQNLLNSYKM